MDNVCHDLGMGSGGLGAIKLPCLCGLSSISIGLLSLAWVLHQKISTKSLLWALFGVRASRTQRCHQSLTQILKIRSSQSREQYEEKTQIMEGRQ